MIKQILSTTTIFLVLLTSNLFFSACQTPPVAANIPAWYPITNDQGDPLYGVFEGRVPNVRSEENKIKLGLALYIDQKSNPTTYRFAQVFVGEGDNRQEIVGSWRFQKGVVGYPEAIVIQLDEKVSPDWRFYWLVNRDLILPLDSLKNPKIGTAAWGYMLSRTNQIKP